mmetsp:Transcript_48270/g.92289  ORF Transcript_48270/g.92289 Transcript_48270/m.92289 type:complete len:242 (-) Transcript_48270:147-872(-)
MCGELRCRGVAPAIHQLCHVRVELREAEQSSAHQPLNNLLVELAILVRVDDPRGELLHQALVHVAHVLQQRQVCGDVHARPLRALVQLLEHLLGHGQRRLARRLRRAHRLANLRRRDAQGVLRRERFEGGGRLLLRHKRLHSQHERAVHFHHRSGGQALRPAPGQCRRRRAQRVLRPKAVAHPKRRPHRVHRRRALWLPRAQRAHTGHAQRSRQVRLRANRVHRSLSIRHLRRRRLKQLPK